MLSQLKKKEKRRRKILCGLKQGKKKTGKKTVAK